MFSKESKVYANGRVVLIDFKYLDHNDFSALVCSQDDLLEAPYVVSMNGIMFINTEEGCELLTEIMKVYANETRKMLEFRKKKLKRKYRKVKDYKDICNLSTSLEKIEALGMLLVDVELDRRKIESNYYL